MELFLIIKLLRTASLFCKVCSIKWICILILFLSIIIINIVIFNAILDFIMKDMVNMHVNFKKY
jgi:hypothetical protein